ncbi:MAG: transglutaminase domain-containing protein [Bacteroidales bacterium]|nr:transglutaminase domain-containing protein [Bacteroidales bacterium]
MKKLLLIIAIALLAISCSNSNLKKEQQALRFLQTSMPSCDDIDYSEDYFLKNIQTSFKAKKEMPWGKRVPEREFKHFVLPIRVNNENLDDFRMAYYEELRDRVKDLSMYDAVLEVNHWCHEKVNYKGSDSRTSSPMATIKTSWGRCGEESTLLVSALRTVCIPARQVYVPRWAHCDDNHAWVEAWVDGQWHFLGACEPEPVLDLGWFNAPASRALLVHTRVLGDYDGPEEVISKTPYYTEINVIDNYAETAKLNVTVVDKYGKTVPDARVDFKIYNYSEYHTVATKYTDNQGNAWLTAGLGTMMVYASKDEKIGWDVVKIGEIDTVTIRLNEPASWPLWQCNDADWRKRLIHYYDYDIIPPAENARIPDVSTEIRAKNNRRLAIEDSIRNAYVAQCVAAQNEGDYDKEIMTKTWGNYQTIKDFIDYARGLDREEDAYTLLRNLTDKDLRDVSIDVLKDCFDGNMLNPRVSNEMLRPYVKTFQETYLPDNVDDLIKWVSDSITVDEAFGESRTPISPAGVLRSCHADSHSRDIFFVALARTAGIPSRIDPVTGKVQYFDNQWVDVEFEKSDDENQNKPGTLVIHYDGTDDPRYYTHFSIKKFNGNTFDLLAYDAMDPGMDVGMTLSQMMADGGITLDEGYYVMSSGPRLADGSVLNHSAVFYIESGETTHVELIMREHIIETFPETSLPDDFVNPYLPENYDKDKYILVFPDGYFPEPTQHAMWSIVQNKKEFDEWGGSVVFVFPNKGKYDEFSFMYPESLYDRSLPNNSIFAIDEKMCSKVVDDLDLKQNTYPILLIINKDNKVIFKDQGYTIDVAERMLNVLK